MPINIEAQWFWAHDYQDRNVMTTIAQLENSVATYGLKPYIKEICVQTIPGTLRNRSGESREDFWLYVGIANSPGIGHLPEKVKNYPPFSGSPFVRVPNDQVIGVLEDWKNRTVGKVLYRAPEITFDSIFDADGGAATNRTADQVLNDTKQYDHLLLWLSAQGSGDYRRFGDICKSLFPDQPDLKPSQIRKHFRLLGHIAESSNGLHWRVLPPLLVPIRIEGRSVTYTLIGARDSHLKERLTNSFQSEGGSFREETHVQGDGPSTWFIVSKNKTVAKQIAKSLGIELCNDYAHCVEQLPDINDYRRLLAKATVSDSHYYDFRLFDGQAFQSKRFEGATGMYEIWTLPDTTPIVKRERTLFFDRKDGCWRSGDWYGLRYLHHKDHKAPTSLLYHKEKEELLCPEAYRLPERYEQALVIASGKLPHLQEARGNRKRVFHGVPQQIAEIVAKKVGARLTVR